MIVDGTRLYTEPVDCNGLLIVGDPHVSSIKPGRRTDADWPGPILRKLEAAVQIANERGLALVMLGDLFQDPVEKDEALKTRLIRILKTLNILAISNTGNHDIRHARLTDGDTLAMLATADNLDVIATGGPVCEFSMGGRRFGMGMTPYGQEIPRDVTGLFPDADAVVWMTHHDIAFEKSYPGAIAPFEIKGCAIVVNGHMHDTKPMVKVGKTMWTNPGNINRQSVDLIDHVPCAWIMHPNGAMEAVPLPHEKSVFDLTGKLVDAIEEKDLVRDRDTAFVTLLKAETTTEMAMSGDGSLMAEEIEAKFQRDKTPDHLQAIIRGLLTEAVNRRNAA